MSRGNGLDHSEKCRKYRQQVENLKMDLEELQEKYDILEQRMERERQKNKDLKGYD